MTPRATMVFERRRRYRESVLEIMAEDRGEGISHGDGRSWSRGASHSLALG